jgi:acetyl-CoA carboxylase biotin carboxylase subunit
MSEAGVPILPGTGVLEGDEHDAMTSAERIGYPLIIKACAGGGGRGMKIVDTPARVWQQVQTARSEAQAAFGNPDVYMERYVQRPRHIEVQVVGDTHGQYAHLGERECSIQRRHQKLVEEAPSVALTEEMRLKLGDIAVKAITKLGYHSVGTLEFLLEEATGQFFFMEMNTRIQVEHTVTEQVTAVDLLREQIHIALGEKLSFAGKHLRPRGHSIEVRVNAEDPVTFAPSPGKITALHLPGGLGVRVDTHIYDQYVVPPFYDSLLAKLIVTAENREACIHRLRRALDEFIVEGISTNIPFHRRLTEHPDFIAGRLDTHFLARMNEPEGQPAGGKRPQAAGAASGPPGTR